MIQREPRIVAAVATITFPVLLLAGFVLHPNLLSPQLTTTAEDLIAKFHGQLAFHVGHLIVLAAVPFIILHLAHVQAVLTGAGRTFGLVGAVVGIFGAVLLAGDKGALCVVLSAFDSLSEADFASIRPALQAIVERRGLLVIFWALPLLPLGAVLQMVGMMKEAMVSRGAGLVAIAGLLLLNNPDLDILSSAGAVLMCLVYVPLGVRMATGKA